MMLQLFQKASLLILLIFFSISCENVKEEEIIAPKSEPKMVEFGFNLHEFNIINDTILAGDTFGSIIEKQNLDGKEVYDIVAKVKDTFDVRTVRIGRAFTLLRSKDRYKKLQVLVYQPDRGNYYVIDFRDSVSVYKKHRPVRVKLRTIAI